MLQEDTRWTKGQAGKRATLSERLRFSGSFFALWKAADIVASRPAAPFLAMQCLVGIAALAFFDTILAKRPCRLLVLANDHSPVATAIMIAARRHGITTVYRQHAPVTPEFPPLIVDVALLYDAASCAAYRSAGEAYPDLLVGRETRMIVLPPFSENCKLIACRGKSRVVGLCLSLVWREAAVIAAIHNLLASGTVNRIIVRPHPANQIDLSPLLMIAGLELDARGRSVADFAKMLDCAIVPNSGVCIELLHHGVPVLYAANMDALGHDLYGFASAGIVPDWTHRPLSDLDDARTFFDADWQERFSAFDASITHDLADLRAEARAALNDYLAEPRAE